MKEWVKPYLIQRLPQRRNRTEEKIPDAAIFYKLTDQLQHDFGSGVGGDSAFFTEIFGSVLAELPKEVFEKLIEMKNVLYIFTPFPGAEVKIFQLDENIKAGTLSIINFPYDSSYMPSEVLRGQIAHELAHVLLEHDCGSDENENTADETAKLWGFEKEIQALRDHWKEYDKSVET